MHLMEIICLPTTVQDCRITFGRSEVQDLFFHMAPQALDLLARRLEGPDVGSTSENAHTDSGLNTIGVLVTDHGV
jgi:hypothetical protein